LEAVKTATLNLLKPTRRKEQKLQDIYPDLP
jgi:hypothetical protein